MVRKKGIALIAAVGQERMVQKFQKTGSFDVQSDSEKEKLIRCHLKKLK